MRAVALTTLSAFVATSCGGRAPGTTHGGGATPVSDAALLQTKDAPPGLDLRLSNGHAGAPAYDRAKLAPATKLGDPDVAAMFARTNAITTDPSDAQAFALRPSSQPVPRTGKTVSGAFPPPPSSLLPPPATGNRGGLTVLRYMPEGKVPLAPQLSVTFSEPMIAVASQADAAATVPIHIAPTPPGHWRWIGTRTIVFDPDVRFPQATTYQVDIPAGIKSASGDALKAATHFTFETPAPTVTGSYPGSGPQRLDVPMFLQFDQKIDPAAVLAKLRVTIGGAPRTIRMLDAAEIARDKQLAAAVKAATDSEQGGRWLAFRTTDPLPTGSTIDIAVPAGTPSAEGPNTTIADQHVSFVTYAPLTLTESSCGYNHTCRPNQPWSIEFNNPLDEDAFVDSQVVIDPPLPGAKLTFQGQTLVVLGATHPRTKYRATIASSLRDQFGQTLGAPKTVTFDVGDAEPTFYGPSDFVIVDPLAKVPALDFFSINYAALKVKLYKVTPADLEAFGHYQQEQWNKDHPPKIPGTKVFDGVVKTAPNAGTLVETHVDLHDALDKSGFGEALAIVEPSPWTETYPPPRLISWVQATKLAVDLHVDGDHLSAFVTDLATGSPVAGATVEMHPFAATATTDAKGIATVALPAKNAPGLRYVTARKGGDQVMVVGNAGEGGWLKQSPAPEIAWYVTDDRQLYKPGEQVSLKGWLRRIELTKGGDVGPLGAGVTAVDYKVTDSRGNQIGKGTAPVNALGGFDTTFMLPKTPNLGSAYVSFRTVGTRDSTYSHVFQIQEFRRPEFSVSAAASQGPFVVGGGGDITVDAKYYAGGPLPGAEVSWNVTAVQSQFTPPNRDDYTFGAWTPWWNEGGRGFDDDYGGGGGRFGSSRSWSLTGKTDGGGSHTLHLDFLSAKPAMPMSVVASANVVDVNRQAQSSTATLLVHPADLYVGVKAAKPFVEQGQPFAVDVIGVDLDGKAAPGAKIEVRAVRLDWEYKHGHYATVERDPQTCSIVAAAAPVPCAIATAKGGSYELTATILDRKGRANQTKLPFWVAGGDQPPVREVRQEQVQLIPDKKEYAPGDTAQILVQSPFYPAEAIVSWRRQGIIHDERLSLTAATTIKVPITDAMTPNLYVQVDVAGAAVRSDDHGDPDPNLPKRPAYAVGVLDLAIPPKQRTLAVTVTPSAAKLAPGESDTLAVVVRDAAGRPVADAEAAVIVVDESILALTGFQFVNPIDVFYNQRPAGAEDTYARGYVKLAAPDLNVIAAATTANEVSRAFAAPGGPPPPPPVMAPAPEPSPDKPKLALREEDEKTPAPGPTTAIAVRTNFNPLAAFSPTVHTGADGTARVPIKVPDNLTRYRVVAIAVAGGQQFGKGESAITARLPLMVRPSPPRFLNFGDTFKLPVVVQNQTDRELKVRVAVRASNASITDGAGREVTVPPNDRVEVQFPAAAELAGTAHFQIVGTAGSYADAAELALPVWTPATTEAFATYGVIDSGATKQPVALPGQVVRQFGGIEVTTASTNLQALTDALLYLVHYPFECAEQRSSRIAAIAALRDVLTAFKTKDMPSAAAMNASVATDIEHLTQMQNGDGSFGFWERGGDGWPYLTVFVTNALVRAKQKGFAVPADMLARAMGYVKTVEQHYPPYYGPEVRAAISAFALYTRKLAGDIDVAKARKVIGDAGGIDKLGMETAGWLLGTLAGNAAAADERKALVRLAMNHVSETAGAASFTTDYGDGSYLLLGSSRRVDGVMLESLIEEQPTLDLIPKIVTGLLAHRKAGRWGNTQEDSFILVALDKYFQTYEKATPDFVARVWLGADYAGDHTFKGHTTEYFTVPIPMTAVAAHDHQDVTIQKDGAGRLYYRIGMTYAPASLKLDAADYGFVVERRYEAIDNPHDVSRAADGSWHIKAGARVRIRLTMVNDNRRYHVALVDPLPAGLETMNPELATTGPIPQDPKEQTSRGAYWWWYSTWYEHQNTRDERTEAFASLLWEGVHNYSYVARATTPGSFVVPPPKAEEMYMPETFGRGASDRVIVE